MTFYKGKIFVTALTLVLESYGAVAQAQQANRVAQIGILDSGTASDPRNALGRDAFRQGFRVLGYVEGKNINIEYRYDRENLSDCRS
jgi:hypothetical protein